MRRILNLTQHRATPDQIEAGVYDIPAQDILAHAIDLLTFGTLPSCEEVKRSAEALAQVASIYTPRGGAVMIGGASFLMPPLHFALEYRGFVPVYAFSSRKSVEKAMPDGSVQKASVFQHLGFVEGL